MIQWWFSLSDLARTWTRSLPGSEISSVRAEVKMFFVPTFTLIIMRRLSSQQPAPGGGEGGRTSWNIDDHMYNVVNRISLMISSHSVTVIRALHQHCTLHSVGVIQTPGATFQPGLASNQTVDGIIKKKQFLKSHSWLNFIPLHLRAVHRFNENAAENYKEQNVNY